jgi:nucleotide-binding universal stress UspA family protein
MKVLIAIDASDASHSALEEIASRPWRPDTSFEVISVVDASFVWATSEVAQDSAHRAQEAVRAAVATLEARKLRATGTTQFGAPKTTILDHATQIGADFVFTGSHNQSGVSRALLGSVAGAVARYARCSVGIIRPDTREKGGKLKVLLATDGSPSSLVATSSVAERPWPARTEVRIFSAVELLLPTPLVLFSPPFLELSVVESARTQAMKHSQEAIQKSRDILASASLDVSESVSVDLEPPKYTIVDEAKQWGADLIVMGSHGHSGLERFLLGTTSESVAMHAPCSVELIRTRT